jgi:hypothetical protein
MSEESTVKKVFKTTPEGETSVGKPRKRWLDDVENNLKKIGVRNWRKMAKARHAWKRERERERERELSPNIVRVIKSRKMN